jgi:hypothetical protein
MTEIQPATQSKPVEDGAQLLADARDALARYVILPDHECGTAVVLRIAATHAIWSWAHAPRLVIRPGRQSRGDG